MLLVSMLYMYWWWNWILKVDGPIDFNKIGGHLTNFLCAYSNHDKKKIVMENAKFGHGKVWELGSWDFVGTLWVDKGNLNAHTTLDLETKIMFTVEQFHPCPVPIMGRCLQQGDGCCVTRSDKTRESSNIHNCSYSFCNFIQLEKIFNLVKTVETQLYIFHT